MHQITALFGVEFWENRSYISFRKEAFLIEYRYIAVIWAQNQRKSYNFDWLQKFKDERNFMQKQELNSFKKKEL